MSRQASQDAEVHLWLCRFRVTGAPIHGYPKWQYDLVVLEPGAFRSGTSASDAAEVMQERYQHHDVSVIHVRPLTVDKLDDKDEWSSFDVIPSKVQLRPVKAS